MNYAWDILSSTSHSINLLFNSLHNGIEVQFIIGDFPTNSDSNILRKLRREDPGQQTSQHAMMMGFPSDP